MYGKKGNKPPPAKGKGGGRGGGGLVDADGNNIDIKELLKQVEFIGHSRMTWKEKKELENRKVVSLGGKPPKKHRMPLSVAKVPMKKQKEREQKMLEEGLVLGRFGGKHVSGTSRAAGKRKAEDRGLMSGEGHFSNGVLDVKHLLHQRPPRDGLSSRPLDIGNFGGIGKKKQGNGKKKSKGKKKGGKKRR